MPVIFLYSTTSLQVFWKTASTNSETAVAKFLSTFNEARYAK